MLFQCPVKRAGWGAGQILSVSSKREFSHPTGTFDSSLRHRRKHILRSPEPKGDPGRETSLPRRGDDASIFLPHLGRIPFQNLITDEFSESENGTGEPFGVCILSVLTDANRWKINANKFQSI
jgi:hypothetical protein